jgi:hypothetical protein
MTEEAGAYNPGTSNAKAEFDPAKHITMISGGAYIEVKWRLVWLHEDVKANGYRLDIATELLHVEPTYAIFKATITILNDNGEVIRRATSHGQEEKSDFGDFLEKAETKAIGRSLAALGYGTQFVPDFEFGAAEGRVVDSPVGGNPSSVHSLSPGGSSLATPKQLKYLEVVAGETGVDPDHLTEEMMTRYGRGPENLTRREASAEIERYQKRGSGAAAS